MFRCYSRGRVLPTRLALISPSRFVQRKAPGVSLRVPRLSRNTRKVAMAVSIKEEDSLPGLTKILDSFKWSSGNLVPVIVQVNPPVESFDIPCFQHVDTGEVLMQAFADRAAICETIQTKLDA